jgi:predicted transcriptional regulator
MARRQTNPLTPAEWKVMKIAWQLKSCAARDVYQEAGKLHGMSTSTVKTHLRRLVEKDFLTTTRVGNSFLYRPSRPPLGSLYRAADRLLENTLDGTTGPLLAYMVKKSKLSAEELARLRDLLDQRQPEGD